MASEAVAAYDSSTATNPPPAAGALELQKVEEQLELVQQESIDSTPKEEVDQLTMSTTEELSKTHADVQPTEPESVPDASKSEVQEKPEEASALIPEEKVKVEIVEEIANKNNKAEASVEEQKETLEGSAEQKVVEENETSEEVSVEDEKPKEVMIEATKVPEALVEAEKTSEAEHLVDVAEEILGEDSKAPVDEPQLLAEAEKTELKETVGVDEVKENQTSEEVSVEDEKPKEVIIEATKVLESSEALVEPEKTSEVVDVAEEILGEERKAPVDEPQLLDEAEKTELIETVDVDEVKEKIEGSTVEGEEEKEVVESIPEVKEEVVEKLQVAEDQGEQEAGVEEESEEIKPRESLGALMKKEVTEEKGSESSDEVAVIDKEVQVEETGVDQLCVPEAVDNGHKEKEKNQGEAKKVEEVSEELAEEVTDAEEKLGKNDENSEVEELKNSEVEELKTDDVSLNNGAAQGSVEVVSESVVATADEALAEISKETEEANQEMEVTAPIESSEETPSEVIKDREVEEVMPEDADETKDAPKEEAVAKPVSKQSNNIMSKVKQSLVKAKKAIIGKSPSSKSISTEIKGDITVK